MENQNLIHIFIQSAEGKRSIKPKNQSIADAITMAASKYFKIQYDKLFSTDRSRPISTARQVSMYMMQVKGVNLVQIANYFGKDHTTVMHGIKTVKDLMSVEPDFASYIVQFGNIIDELFEKHLNNPKMEEFFNWREYLNDEIFFSGYGETKKDYKAMGGHKRRRVLVYLDGEYYDTYNKPADASRKLGISTDMITAVCRGERKGVKGYTFYYEDEQKQIA